MVLSCRKTFLLNRIAAIAAVMLALVLTSFAQGKNPVILVPGLSGSELLHKGTMKRVWFRVTKSKSEDLRLPVMADPSKMHDDLIPGDVLRKVKIGIFPVTDIYGGFIKAMEERGGYHEEKWDSPSEKGYQDSLYVFPYDWRLDIVQNSKLLIQRIDKLRKTLKKPDLKFDIVAHSMGGIISRYAAMYGDADLPAHNAKPQPTWAGSRYFNKVILLGTPNEGSTLSLDLFVNGFTIGGFKIDLPFLQDVSKFATFTIPAAYQLLPAPGTMRVYNDKLEPVAIDIYDPKTWSRYGWNVMNDKRFAQHFSAAERKAAPAYFAAVLNRAKRLHEALAAVGSNTGNVTFYQVGSDCKTALDSIVVYEDKKENKWKTLFKPKGFSRADGQKVSDDDLKKVMLRPGDGIVTRRSLDAETLSDKLGLPSVFIKANENYICEDHNKLAANSQIQDYVISILTGTATPAKEKGVAAASKKQEIK